MPGYRHRLSGQNPIPLLLPTRISHVWEMQAISRRAEPASPTMISLALFPTWRFKLSAPRDAREFCQDLHTDVHFPDPTDPIFPVFTMPWGCQDQPLEQHRVEGLKGGRMIPAISPLCARVESRCYGAEDARRTGTLFEVLLEGVEKNLETAGYISCWIQVRGYQGSTLDF